MADTSQGIILFADDIRNEVSGKTSIMGVFGPELELSQKGEIDLYCVILIWASAQSLNIVGTIEVEGVPSEYNQPKPLNTSVPVPENGGTPLVHIFAKLPTISFEEEVIYVRARFTLNDISLSASLKISLADKDDTENRPPPKRMKLTNRKKSV